MANGLELSHQFGKPFLENLEFSVGVIAPLSAIWRGRGQAVACQLVQVHTVGSSSFWKDPTGVARETSGSEKTLHEK